MGNVLCRGSRVVLRAMAGDVVVGGVVDGDREVFGKNRGQEKGKERVLHIGRGGMANTTTTITRGSQTGKRLIQDKRKDSEYIHIYIYYLFLFC